MKSIDRTELEEAVKLMRKNNLVQKLIRDGADVAKMSQKAFDDAMRTCDNITQIVDATDGKIRTIQTESEVQVNNLAISANKEIGELTQKYNDIIAPFKVQVPQAQPVEAKPEINSSEMIDKTPASTEVKPIEEVTGEVRLSELK